MADFDAPVITIAGLARFDLPGHTLRLCDGGTLRFEGEAYQSSDPVFGTIESVDPFSEGSGDEAPAGSLTFLPRTATAAATLSQPGYQGSRIRFWLGRVDPQSGTLMGEPELVADMELDTTTVRVAKGSRVLDVGMIAAAERLFNVNEGNVLSGRFHQSVWPGEQGFDNANGVGTVVAWGVASPPRGSVNVGSGGGGGGIDGGTAARMWARSL